MYSHPSPQEKTQKLILGEVDRIGTLQATGIAALQCVFHVWNSTILHANSKNLHVTLHAHCYNLRLFGLLEFLITSLAELVQ